MYTKEQTELIAKCQQKQIAKPARAIVNTESAFVKDMIAKTDPLLATNYWNWVCFQGPIRRPEEFGVDVLNNEILLQEIDANQRMPEWGYSGT